MEALTFNDKPPRYLLSGCLLLLVCLVCAVLYSELVFNRLKDPLVHSNASRLGGVSDGLEQIRREIRQNTALPGVLVHSSLDGLENVPLQALPGYDSSLTNCLPLLFPWFNRDKVTFCVVIVIIFPFCF